MSKSEYIYNTGEIVFRNNENFWIFPAEHISNQKYVVHSPWFWCKGEKWRLIIPFFKNSSSDDFRSVYFCLRRKIQSSYLHDKYALALRFKSIIGNKVIVSRICDIHSDYGCYIRLCFFKDILFETLIQNGLVKLFFDIEKKSTISSDIRMSDEESGENETNSDDEESNEDKEHKKMMRKITRNCMKMLVLDKNEINSDDDESSEDDEESSEDDKESNEDKENSDNDEDGEKDDEDRERVDDDDEIIYNVGGRNKKKHVSSDASDFKGIKILAQNLKQVFLDEQMCDVVLKVGDREFNAHKLILVARSPVFASMFQHDLAEKNTNIVNIPDCTAESFEVFLQYLYSGSADTLSIANVYNLYYAADKYRMDDLKEMCVKFMKSHLSTETICDIIALSLRHEECMLLKVATRFFCKNAKEIVKSVQWQNYMAENSSQANQLIIKALNS